MKELTRAEEQIMLILWDLKQACVKEIQERMPEPKPAYTTISTIIRILQVKGYVNHEEVGKTHRYYPLVDKETYTHRFMKNFIGNYFENSFAQMVSFFTKAENIDIKTLDEILQQVKNSQTPE